MSDHTYTEDQLVEQPPMRLFAEMDGCWRYHTLTPALSQGDREELASA